MTDYLNKLKYKGRAYMYKTTPKQPKAEGSSKTKETTKKKKINQ